MQAEGVAEELWERPGTVFFSIDLIVLTLQQNEYILCEKTASRILQLPDRMLLPASPSREILKPSLGELHRLGPPSLNLSVKSTGPNKIPGLYFLPGNTKLSPSLCSP